MDAGLYPKLANVVNAHPKIATYLVLPTFTAALGFCFAVLLERTKLIFVGSSEILKSSKVARVNCYTTLIHLFKTADKGLHRITMGEAHKHWSKDKSSAEAYTFEFTSNRLSDSFSSLDWLTKPKGNETPVTVAEEAVRVATTLQTEAASLYEAVSRQRALLGKSFVKDFEAYFEYHALSVSRRLRNEGIPGVSLDDPASVRKWGKKRRAIKADLDRHIPKRNRLCD